MKSICRFYLSIDSEACVEFKQQNKLSASKTAVKLQSAAFNLFQLIAHGQGDTDLCTHASSRLLDYFDSPEQMHQHFSLSVTPNEILQAAARTYSIGERSPLYYEIFKLMLAKIGPQTTPMLRTFIIQRFNEAPFTLTVARNES